MQVSLLQCQSSRKPDENLAFIQQQLEQLPRQAGEPQLVVLPECALLFGGHEGEQLAWSATDAPLNLTEALAALARQYQVYLVGGTVPAASGDGRVYSRSILFDDQGGIVGSYDKLHLFDVDVSDNTGSYRESDTFCGGDHLSVLPTPFGQLGLTVCYDLRFADLFRALRLQGAELIVVPAAFTKVTGAAHWEVLLRARAIESQCYILAAGQWGAHNQGGRETWGQSMIIDPWGRIVAQQASGIGWVQAPIDLSLVAKVRQDMPVCQHNRFAAPQLQPLQRK
ncbi:carbon-nitrogen hydrolase family protein [Shewanella sp. C32]|uniref:Carbon-nitrogen hydrolase family protein n=1 Tax=Shewanella electrica TaxID=515560 RepID=A0ABT2FL86_9GAMM|nr:carbon-nitrogen hydrolase family protein [Shewanella electrica]MCH1924106.1 carbon-nitrogen hydrolase family protein [Shewanella electrica]MCS4556009.1 carbon-nitrogen hydrolase family protein [Shewanella electrica]